MTYADKLKSPKWQKRRLEIMQRDMFRCRRCGSDDKQLHVHHIYYDKEYKEPWDYPDHLLTTICNDCHELEGNIKVDGLSMCVLDNLIKISNKTLVDIDNISVDAYFMQMQENYTEKEALKICYLKFIQGL
jgi:5-methylcytosine-specific restriction endonuclease McrA